MLVLPLNVFFLSPSLTMTINHWDYGSVRRMYIINNEICSRLVCKEHEVMKDELCRQMAGLPPRRLRRSNYFRLPPCENVNLQRPSGLWSSRGKNMWVGGRECCRKRELLVQPWSANSSTLVFLKPVLLHCLAFAPTPEFSPRLITFISFFHFFSSIQYKVYIIA